MKRTAVPLLAAFLEMTEEVAVPDAKAESEMLMNAALPFAEKTLRAHGEFYPYAYTLSNDHSIAMVAGYDGREHPPSQDIIDLLKIGLRSDAAALKIRASAIIYDVRIRDPANGVKSDAIAVALDHADHYSVVVIFPYTLMGGQLNLLAPFSQQGASDIFTR
ncbi:MAG: hypothetical protein JSS86_00025 [Cyanobacteria bacterium SZAS LIN-2]|nr:hypothetical protein [Cyanobacteria bacterium SZAS LIN-2]